VAAVFSTARTAEAADDVGACLAHIDKAEKTNKIPEGLLKSIGFAESGRTVDGRRGAWPWTVNAQGEGRYFDSKDEAVAFVQELQAQGVSVIDVGCMQVNLHHHPEAFASLDAAFDPATNVAYAAKFLTWLHDETKDWATSARYYHSRTPSLGRAYAARLTVNAFGKVISSIGPIVPLTKEERRILAADVAERMAATDELLAKSRAMRQPKRTTALTAVEQAAIAVEPAAGSTNRSGFTPTREAAASADAALPPAATARSKNR
jgi:Transglycosylase SLT domain